MCVCVCSGVVCGFNVEPNTYIFFCYFFELLKKLELAGMCGVTFVGTTHRRVFKLRYEVEWFVALMSNLTRTFFFAIFLSY